MSMVPGMTGAGSLTANTPLSARPLEGVTASITTQYNNANIAWPGDNLPGDVFVLFDHAHIRGSGPGVPTKVIPSGFGELADESDYYQVQSGPTVVWQLRGVISLRKLTATQAGNITGMSHYTYTQKVLMRLRGTNRPINNVYNSTFLHGWGPNPAQQTIDMDLGDAMPKIALGMVAGYEVNFASLSPSWEAITDMLEDIPGGGYDNYRTRVGRKLYAKGATTTDQLVDINQRGLLLSGMLWFD